jgi:topoisomerase-4 subunit A
MEHIDVDEFIGVKSSKARGKRVSNYEVGKVTFIEPLEKEPEPTDEEQEDEEDGPVDLSLDPEDTSNAKQMDLGL